MKIIKKVQKQEACAKEIELIAKWDLCNSDKGYNNTYGGEHGHMSEEAKARFSLQMKGKGFWKGKRIPEEAKRKMSEVKKGKTPTSNPPKKVFCEETSKVYKSLTDASKHLGISPALASKICNKRYVRKPKYRLHFVGEEQ